MYTTLEAELISIVFTHCYYCSFDYCLINVGNTHAAISCIFIYIPSLCFRFLLMCHSLKYYLLKLETSDNYYNNKNITDIYIHLPCIISLSPLSPLSPLSVCPVSCFLGICLVESFESEHQKKWSTV